MAAPKGAWLELKYPNPDQRAVFGALVTAGEPVTNTRLAEIMHCSAAEASKRVANCNGFVTVVRQGRKVLISLA